jgi:16S rRNA (cytosine967-C5)-methyltransferase
MPEWITERFLKQYGEEQTEQILQAFLADHPLTIRTHTGRITPEGLKQMMVDAGITVENPAILADASEAEKRLAGYAFFLSGYDSVRAIPGYEEGFFYIQDLSSMMVAEMAEIREGAQVLDVCAAPGGKSLHLFERKKGSCRIEMRDLTEEKTDLIRENIQKYEPDAYGTALTVSERDAAIPDPDWEGKADLVLADLPCSGLGVIGHKADIKYHADENRIREMAKLQKQILSAVHRCVKPGGTLLYSTCSVLQDEDEEQVTAFLERYPSFSPVPVELKGFDCVNGMLRSWPHRSGNDGFFAARLVKKND